MEAQMAGGGLRLFRSLLVTGTVFVLAAGAHVLGGGSLPTADISLALLALVLAGVMSLAGRQLSLAKIAAVLAGGQILLHEALNVLSGASSCQAAASSDSFAHHAVQAASLPCQSPPSSLLIHESAGYAMSLAHLFATAVTAVVLGKAEAALWQLAAWLRPLARFLAPTPVPTCRPVPCGPAPAPARPRWRNLRGDGIRGPPWPDRALLPARSV
ncbi:hypothetical protein LFT45_22350 (plasmid) [Arthrobacter sp. FW305-BF8]|uniref:hypothetical protein n=1 Tax=Arthrobacter sp. FW305-BF8 TaxID=2879617 RepID=UPI001F2A5CDD|nr:hypothetical protein [Arthrobacter sp. FW305-BF8]UKA56623.1 hypothetical protein LFT45_22350 [Arthrobacter sp. FW305-BF8]